MNQEQAAKFIIAFRKLVNKVASLESRLIEVEEDDVEEDEVLAQLTSEIDAIASQLEPVTAA